MQHHLDGRGWARLPPLDPRARAALTGLADELATSFGEEALQKDLGIDDLWGNRPHRYRTEMQARILAAFASFLEGCFFDYRPILGNIFLKRPLGAVSANPFHQDFALVDERLGDTALQLWIPLVDVDVDNGALVIVEGTHEDAPAVRPFGFRCRLHEHSLTSPPPGAVDPRLPAGEGVVFMSKVIHGSTPNVSSSLRPAAACVLVPTDASLIHWVERSPERFELWGLHRDEDLLSLAPGRLPPGATLLETLPGAP